MARQTRRLPENYDGVGITTYRIGDILTDVLATLSETYQERPDLVLAAWAGIIGAKLAPMTQALSFSDGVLLVKVRNSTLHEILHREKGKILKNLRQKFPKVSIQNIMFRIG